ncbi:unnamed protein product [Larinioides sclopetarius]|uniref:CRAL/TRIO N-terminal domain-containing protein n=1 Tax=Larinioides sclopetarius TaxID=280406 RepID=A0AAV2AU82_9ARAC
MWYPEVSESERQVIEELQRRTESDVSPTMLQDETLFYRFAKARDFNLVSAEAMLRNVSNDFRFSFSTKCITVFLFSLLFTKNTLNTESSNRKNTTLAHIVNTDRQKFTNKNSNSIFHIYRRLTAY